MIISHRGSIENRNPTDEVHKEQWKLRGNNSSKHSELSSARRAKLHQTLFKTCLNNQSNRPTIQSHIQSVRGMSRSSSIGGLQYQQVILSNDTRL